MSGKIADLLRQGRHSAFLGRDRELHGLLRISAQDGPVVAYLHGPAGIGKSALLAAFETSLADAGIHSGRIAAGAVEPLPTAISAALAAVLGSPTLPLAQATALAGNMIVVMIDDVDTWRLAASWLRTELIPAMPINVRFVLAGRAAPPGLWTSEYGPHFLDMRIAPLERKASDAIAAAAGLPPSLAERVWVLTAGHPLGLRMAIHAAGTGALDTARDAGELANAILHAIGDSELRRAAEACAVVRRASRALVSAILESTEPVPLSLLEAVEALPFATRDAEGLYVVEPVRQAIIGWMSGVDAERYQAWRTIAADWFVARLRTSGRARRWRHMADLLDLLDEPSLRNAFFPTDTAAPPVEPAQERDFEQIFEIAETNDGSDERTRLEAWAQRLSYRFSVARGPNSEVLAFYVFARQDDPISGLGTLDPVIAECERHLAENPVAGEVLFVRQISARAGNSYRAGRIACILDLKRNYIERGALSRIYCYAAVEDINLLFRLGFRPLAQSHAALPGTMVLDVPGDDIVRWVSALVDAGSAARSGDGEFTFVRDRREVLVEGRVVELTPLESQVLARLIDRAPAVVGRDEFIEHIWQRTFVGSNVVDTVVRTLRKKLGPQRASIQTIPKAGYRYIGSARPD